jgi:hypothetical protein
VIVQEGPAPRKVHLEPRPQPRSLLHHPRIHRAQLVLQHGGWITPQHHDPQQGRHRRCVSVREVQVLAIVIVVAPGIDDVVSQEIPEGAAISGRRHAEATVFQEPLHHTYLSIAKES